MAGIRIGLRSMSDLKKIEFARGLVRKLSDNPHFPSVTTVLAKMTAAISELEMAHNEARLARQNAKEKTRMSRSASIALDGVLKQIARFVEIAAAGDPKKLKTSGFDARAGKAPIGKLAAPQNVLVEIPGAVGEAHIRWKHVRGASTYLIQSSAKPEDASSWTQAAVSTRARAILTGLARGTRLWFRVCAVGAAGIGPWSSATERFVP